MDDEKLQEVFKMAGKVVNVDLSKDPDTKKSRGFGVIEFEHPVEAVQAISMLHGQWWVFDLYLSQIPKKKFTEGLNAAKIILHYFHVLLSYHYEHL